MPATIMIFAIAFGLGCLATWLVCRDMMLEKFNAGFDAGWEANEATRSRSDLSTQFERRVGMGAEGWQRERLPPPDPTCMKRSW